MKPALVFAFICVAFLISAQFARHVTAHRFRVARSAPTPSGSPSQEPMPLSVPIAPASPHPQPRQEPGAEQNAPAMTIQVTGDANVITFRPSGFVNTETHYQLDGDSGTSVFPVGPHQTARVDLKGDANTVRVAAELKDRITIVNNGDGNNVVN